MSRQDGCTCGKAQVDESGNWQTGAISGHLPGCLVRPMLTREEVEARVRTAPRAEGQETIVMSRADRYLDTLEEMVAVGRKRNDPTLAIAVSVEMLGLLVAEVRAARRDGA